MRRYYIVSRILLTLSVITFALAAPALVQEERQAPEDAITVLEKRTREQDLDMLWDGLRYYEHVWGNRPAGVHLHEPAPPPNMPAPDVDEAHVQGVIAPAPNPAGVHVPEVHVPPQDPVDPDRELMDLEDDAPPGTPKSGHSDSQPPSPGSTKSEDWFTAPSSSSSPTESESDSERWSTISNAPSADSLTENLNTADNEMRGKAKVLRRISGIASRVDTVNAAQTELRSVDPMPSLKN